MRNKVFTYDDHKVFTYDDLSGLDDLRVGSIVCPNEHGHPIMVALKLTQNLWTITGVYPTGSSSDLFGYAKSWALYWDLNTVR